MKIYRTIHGLVIEKQDRYYSWPGHSIDEIFRATEPQAWVEQQIAKTSPISFNPQTPLLRAPLASQEIWAAGVTYFRSKTARMEEAKSAGGGDFYDRVYAAERPELFFKSTPHRVVGSGQAVRIRRDAQWNVPEPELTLAINASGTIFGYTVGNDVSSRDIEGENPLYLPQAKVYDQSAAIGPCLYLSSTPLPPDTEIQLVIQRAGQVVTQDSTKLEKMKRTFSELAAYLFRDNSFPNGCYLMTGTGIVPPDSFTLQPGDEIAITIPVIGTLRNTVVQG